MVYARYIVPILRIDASSTTNVGIFDLGKCTLGWASIAGLLRLWINHLILNLKLMSSLAV